MYRRHLPQLDGGFFVTDGGLETTLIFHDGFDLPQFAAFDVLKTREGHEALRTYYRSYATIARNNNLGFVIESPTWRASSAWGGKLGYSGKALAGANREAVGLCGEIRDELEADGITTVVSGCIGPRSDGYSAGDQMSAEEAEEYHGAQMEVLRDTEADMAAALTMTYPEEAIGVTRAARKAGMPAAISFTVETDGRLPSGAKLDEAIRQVDEATDAGPAYYMINCAHPAHFEHVLSGNGLWRERIRGVRANASEKSHAELDGAAELDDGDPRKLASCYQGLRGKLPQMNLIGGCCGTDARHIEAICRAWIG